MAEDESDHSEDIVMFRPDSRLEGPLEVVEALGPAVLERGQGLLVPEAAMGELHRRDATGLREVDLDQLLDGVFVVVPDPGERESPRWVDLRVLTPATVL